MNKQIGQMGASSISVDTPVVRCFPYFIRPSLERVIIIMFFSFIPIDMINGVLLRNNLPSISIFYKLIVLILSVIFLLRKNYLFSVLGTFSLLGLYFFYQSVLLGDFVSAAQGLDWLIKFSAIFLFYRFFSIIIYERNEDWIFSIVFISFSFLVINIILGGIGLGYPMYSMGDSVSIGTRGFIYAGNEISAALVISGALVQMRLLEANKFFSLSVISLLMIVSSALITSKTAIFSSILLVISFPIIKAISTMKFTVINKIHFYYSISMIALVSISTSLVAYYVFFLTRMSDRITYFLSKIDLITLIFSYRNVWAKEALNILDNRYSFADVLFGTSMSWTNYIADKKIVEIDPIDFLMTYGLLLLLLSYGFLFSAIFRTWRSRSIYSKYIIFTILLTIGLSTTSGHILNSGTAGFLISALVAMSHLGGRRFEDISNFKYVSIRYK